MTDSAFQSGDPRPRWRPILSFLLLLASIAIWLPAGDVPKLILEQDPVLLGRYSKEQFSLLFFATPGLWLAAWLFWRDRWATREAKFKAFALTLGIVVAVIGVDIIGRAMRAPRYHEESVQEWTRWPGERVDGPVRTRPPDMTYHVTYADVPPHARSYPDAPPGFGTVECTLTTDSRGFRNTRALERADIVVIGDSFVEGSRVDDDESWPVLVGDALGTTVYCLGISGGSPGSYVSNFMVHARGLRPRIAVFMVYEGNDFDAAADRAAPSINRKISNGIRRSPIVLGLRRSFVNVFGAINANGTVEHEAFAWMPVEIRGGDRATYCAFPPKRLIDIMWTTEEFEQTRGWQQTSAALRQAIEACREAGVQPVIALAPTAPHVLMPLIRDNLTPEQLRAFMIVTNDDLPPAQACFDEVFSGLDVAEHTLAQFCSDENVMFVSPTAILRERTAAGDQTYYTYDQHWTSHGHAAVAETMAEALRSIFENSD